MGSTVSTPLLQVIECKLVRCVACLRVGVCFSEVFILLGLRGIAGISVGDIGFISARSLRIVEFLRGCASEKFGKVTKNGAMTPRLGRKTVRHDAPV